MGVQAVNYFEIGSSHRAGELRSCTYLPFHGAHLLPAPLRRRTAGACFGQTGVGSAPACPGLLSASLCALAKPTERPLRGKSTFFVWLTQLRISHCAVVCPTIHHLLCPARAMSSFSPFKSNHPATSSLPTMKPGVPEMPSSRARARFLSMTACH